MRSFAIAERVSTAHTYAYRGLTLVRGEGVFLYDDKNQAYLDLGSNYGVNILGYGHPIFSKNISAQLKRLVNLHSSFSNDLRSEAALALRKRAKKELDSFYKLIFASSGSEAVDNAVKIALFLADKKKVLCFSSAYHGKTFLSVFLSDNPRYRQGLPNIFEDLIIRARFNDPVDVEDKIRSAGVVLLELLQGDGGVVSADKDFVKALSDLCRRNNVIMIVDEIQTGIGRTGRFFASQEYGLEPDILLLGKGLAGGIPASAVLIRDNLSKKLYRGIQTSTFGGNPLAMAGILSVLEVVDEGFCKNVEKTGRFFKNRLKSLGSDMVGEVRGKGLMLGLRVEKDRRDGILKKLQKNGIIALPASDDVVRFLPPLILSRNTLQKYWRVIVESFSDNI